MKIRNGFVSNSSSSSFVILGVKKNLTEDEMENLPKGIRALYIEEKDFNYVVGHVFSDSDEELKETTTSLDRLNELAQYISNELNVDINEVNLITGTRYC